MSEFAERIRDARELMDMLDPPGSIGGFPHDIAVLISIVDCLIEALEALPESTGTSTKTGEKPPAGL